VRYAKLKKPNIAWSCSFVEPRHKMMIMIIIMGHECEREIVLWEDSGNGTRERKGH
jgi:hypothetical protein